MLGFAGVVIEVKMDPLVMGNVSGMVGAVQGGEAGWVLFTISGVELLKKFSSMNEREDESIFGLSGRTDSASSTLDFQES